MKDEIAANRAVEMYADTVRRICFMHLKNYADVEDVFQEVFLKYIRNEIAFENENHEKAWFIRVTINACKDLLKSFFRSKVRSIDDVDINAFYIQEQDNEVLETVLKLPDKYKNIVYLYYFEGYSAVEMAKLLGKKENTIYTWLARARALMKVDLGVDGLA